MTIQKILIVDDSPTERYFLTDILIKNGFSVSTAENGEEALLKIKADKPHLVLMDIVMPGQNGFQVTRAISRDPPVPSPGASSTSRTLIESEAGENGFWRKFTPSWDTPCRRVASSV